MAKANRHYLAGPIWHLTHRCHQRQFLLKLARDRQAWIDWLFEARKRFGVGGRRDPAGQVETMDGGKWGFIDPTGKMVIPPQFDNVEPYSQGLARVWDESKKSFSLIDKAGNAINGPRYKEIGNFSGHLALAKGEDGLKFINSSGEVVFEVTADWVAEFSAGFAPVRNGAKYGFIDQIGSLAIPCHFDEAWLFSEGFAPVKKGRWWGYVDVTGALVIPAKFDTALQFVDGLALVETGKIWSTINKRRKIVRQDVWRMP